MDSLTYYMGIIKKNLNSFLNETFKPLNITGVEAPVLKFISENPCCRQIEIAKHFGCDKAHTHRVITKLMEKSLVEYASVERQELKLTASGESIIATIEKGVSQWKEAFMQNISPQEIETLFSVLKKCAENTEKLKMENKDD